jgi:hypothetical protein
MMKRYAALMIFVLLISVSISGCGSSSKSEVPIPRTESTAVKSSAPGAPVPASPAAGNAANKTQPADARKVIETAQVTLETRDLPSVEAKISALLESKNGKIDVSNVSVDSNGHRNGNYTLRVPQGQLQPFVKEIAAIPDVIVRQRNISAQDVTEEFIDINARLENMQRHETRLREILAKANTVDEILKVEKELAAVRTQIESVTARLKTMTSRIEMSTVNLRISEVTLATESNYGGKIMRVVRDSIVGAGDVVLYLIAFVIIASPLVLIIGIGIWYYRRKKKLNLANPSSESKPPENRP